MSVFHGVSPEVPSANLHRKILEKLIPAQDAIGDIRVVELQARKNAVVIESGGANVRPKIEAAGFWLGAGRLFQLPHRRPERQYSDRTSHSHLTSPCQC